MPLVLADVVDCADVGVIQGRSRLRLALKTSQRLCVACQFGGQELECDKAMQPRVFGFVNHTHTTAGEETHDAKSASQDVTGI
jgi:hypothetical protein